MSTSIRRAGCGLWMTAVVAMMLFAPPAWAQQAAGEAEGARRLAQQQEDKPVHMCPGCLAPIFTQEGRGSITPYGRIELDGIYSNRNTNPLDPAQFNGYATAAGSNSHNTSTLNPRYSVFGIRADRTDGVHTLTGVVEADFYGEKDNAGNLPPRLRLAYARYTYKELSLTVGQDWTPVMALHPDLIDFSIMGYGGNLWQRIPQITFRYQFNENLEGVITVMRFERGLYAIAGQRQVRPQATPKVAQGDNPVPGGASNDAFSDPIQHPYYGTRFAYSKDGMLLAVSAAYRYYRSAPYAGSPTGFGGNFTSGRDINSYLVGGEVVIPLTKVLKFSGELAYGQALGQEFFRFGQDLNLTTGKPIRTLMGWGQLSWAASRKYTFLAGAGMDNPLDQDVRGSTVNVDTQYKSNYRTYLTAIHPIWSDFYIGLEWQHLWTTWAVGTGSQHYQGDTYNIAFWYNF
ncbi:MAG TPA: hypothetical protein VNK46_04300 [Nitrospiraceae bacterium]|nr:hypothetical protein [Nitrospiraceae bacterium]